MDIGHYHYNVYHQFFSKVEEVDYFLQEADRNEKEFRQSDRRDLKYLNRMQFIFSACVGALVSVWEVVRLSKQIRNYSEGVERNLGLPNEYELVNDAIKFHSYFGNPGDEAYAWFCFLKSARNANAHDGSCAANGGNSEIFKFQSDLHRFEWDRSDKKFKYVCVDAPEWGTVTSLLAMAHILVPMFFSKLDRPEISEELGQSIARFNIESSYGLMGASEEEKEAFVSSLVAAQASVPEKEIDSTVAEWKSMFDARFETA